jgi:hypothetical protein
MQAEKPALQAVISAGLKRFHRGRFVNGPEWWRFSVRHYRHMSMRDGSKVVSLRWGKKLLTRLFAFGMLSLNETNFHLVKLQIR